MSSKKAKKTNQRSVNEDTDAITSEQMGFLDALNVADSAIAKQSSRVSRPSYGLAAKNPDKPVSRPRPSPTKSFQSQQKQLPVDETIFQRRPCVAERPYSGLSRPKPACSSSKQKCVPKLVDLCVRVLKTHIDDLEYLGPIPIELILPVLELCTAQQLFTLEWWNPSFVDATEHLWKRHGQRDFHDSLPASGETWREYYVRRHDEREARRKELPGKLAKKYAALDRTGPHAKLAFTGSYVKPPRSLRTDPTNWRLTSIVRPTNSSGSSAGSQSSVRKRPPSAPLMNKVLKQLKCSGRR